MFIVNKFYLLFLYFLYLSLHYKYQKKFLVYENLLGNKSDSDFNLHSEEKLFPDLFFSMYNVRHLEMNTSLFGLIILFTCAPRRRRGGPHKLWRRRWWSTLGRLGQGGKAQPGPHPEHLCICRSRNIYKCHYTLTKGSALIQSYSNSIVRFKHPNIFIRSNYVSPGMTLLVIKTLNDEQQITLF